MKKAYLVMGAGLWAGMLIGVLQAQDLRQPVQVLPTTYHSRFYSIAPPLDSPSSSPSDVVPTEPAAPAEEKPAPAKVATNSVPCQCNCRDGLLSCSLGDPWTVPQPCFLQKHGIRMGGWIEQGITFNADNVANQFNGPVATNDLDHEWQVNQIWLYFDKQADNGGCGFAWGGHVDLLYGTDWRFGINHGLEDRINGFDYQTYGMVIPQMYLEFAYNKLSVKLGHFAGILDYEVIPSIFNPFYSHSYSYGYGVPQLVTGALANYKLNDRLSVQAGFHRGWLMFEDYNHDLDFMGGVRWDSADSKTSVAYALSVGPQDPAGEQNRFVYSLVVQRQLTEKLRYVAVHNLGTQRNSAPGGGTAEWYSLCNYFLRKINPCWDANLRFEWFRDDDGVRVAGPGNIPGVRAWDGAGYAGNFYELTAGLTWRPNANVTLRPELRWDWYDGLASAKPGNALPFNDGESTDQFLAACDLLITF